MFSRLKNNKNSSFKKKITLEKHINIKHPEAKNPNKMGLREGQFGLDVRQVKEKETETPKNQLKKKQSKVLNKKVTN